MYTKKLLLFILIPILFFLFGFFQPDLFIDDNRSFIINLTNKNKPYFVNGTARIPAVFEGFNKDTVVFTDSKGQRDELSLKNIPTPIQYWAALDNDLDVPISKDSFTAGAKIIVTLGVNPDNGDINTVWLELDKSRS